MARIAHVVTNENVIVNAVVCIDGPLSLLVDSMCLLDLAVTRNIRVIFYTLKRRENCKEKRKKERKRHERKKFSEDRKRKKEERKKRKKTKGRETKKF